MREQSVESPDELEVALRSLHEEFRSQPILVELIRPDGASLAMGVGESITVLSYNPSADPPYFVSIGDEESPGTVWFGYFGAESEFSLADAVTVESGREAMKSFLHSGRPPTEVGWQEV